MQSDRKAFVTLRFAGDDLNPREISAILPVEPTRAHRKGEEFFAGPNAGNLRGRTGTWFLATDKLVASDNLADHLRFIEDLLYSKPGDTGRISNLRDILERTHSRAHVTCFWRGDPPEPAPQIPAQFKSAMAPLSAALEADFASANYKGLKNSELPKGKRSRRDSRSVREVLSEALNSGRDLEIDQIKGMLEPFIKGMQVESPIFDPGAFLYRARKIGDGFEKGAGIRCSDLSYPPAERTRLGRVNRPRKPVFYCSMAKESVFFEIQDLNPGDELILSFWKTTDSMMVNNVGYTQFVFERLGAKRVCPQWKPQTAADQETFSLAAVPEGLKEIILTKDANREIRSALSEHFADLVNQEDAYRYKLTTAIGELHLGSVDNKGEFAGLLYPSVRMWANGDNLALLPSFVDRSVVFRKAQHIRIDSKEGTRFSITVLDQARVVDRECDLRWQGPPNWILKPSQGARFTATPGPDSDGDYLISAQGTPCHWEAVDMSTGEIIKPA